MASNSRLTALGRGAVAIASAMLFALLAVPPSAVWASGPLLRTLQLRAAHNAYHLDRSPVELIDKFNIWEVEIDFGIKSGAWRVGHDDVESKFGLDLLSEWLGNIASCQSRLYHPILVKLEAKNPSNHCDWPGCTTPCCGWGWTEYYDWPPNWAGQNVKPIIESAFGTEATGLFTPAELSAWQVANHSSEWPPMEYVRDNGPFVVSLQDNQSPTQVPDDPGAYFGGGFDAYGLSSISADDCSSFNYGIAMGYNRLALDGGYTETWSNIFVHSAVPSYVFPSGPNWLEWGTALQPFRSLGHAVNAARTVAGTLTSGALLISPGNYPEKLTLASPLTASTIGGSARIGGAGVAYTVILQLQDVSDAGTTSAVYATLSGIGGSAPEIQLTNPATSFARGCTEIFWMTSVDIGALKSITIRVGGSDDVALQDIVVDQATSGRYHAAGLWVGNDHVNPLAFTLSRIP